MDRPPGNVIWIEVGDFLRYFDGSVTPTGIARVQSQLFPELLAAFPNRVRFCRIGLANDDVRLLDLNEILRHSDVERFLRRHGMRRTLPFFQFIRFLARRGRRAIDARRNEDTRFADMVRPGDVLLNLGAAWDHKGFAEKVARLKARYGVQFALLVHDVLPVSHPQFVSPGHAPNFRLWLGRMASVWDVVLTPSNYSGDALDAYLNDRALPRPRMHTIPFGSGFRAQSATSSIRTPVTARKHVLYVSTIEIRKNHLLMVRVWERFLDEYGADRLPDLVFAGKYGWEIAPLLDALKQNRHLGGRIQVVENLSDTSLSRLYRDARFTVFPSYCEGWGLPVAESLYFGRYCVASDATSVPEVGGNWVDYHRPDDFESAYRLVERAILDDKFLEGREAHIEIDYRPPTWRRTAEAVGGLLLDDSAKAEIISFPQKSASATAGR